tara:strand:+ start:660 stop:1439 length:780 start_codon:yes stop_codon:yes gene_type:complete
MADRLTQRDIEFLKKLRSGDRIKGVDMKKIGERAKKFADRLKDDPSSGMFEDSRKPTLEEEIIRKIRQRASKKKSFNVGGLGRAAGRGLGGAGKKGLSLNEKLKESHKNLKESMKDLKKFKEKRKEKYNKPVTPLGKMKKQGPKPGTMDYFLQETMKPGYKVAPMATGGDTFGKMLDKKFIKYAGSKQAQLHAKDYDEGLDRAERRAALETKQAYKKNKKTEKKLMGGGMMKKPMGYTTGGVCKGMGAAIRGGNFKGVK